MQMKAWAVRESTMFIIDRVWRAGMVKDKR